MSNQVFSGRHALIAAAVAMTVPMYAQAQASAEVPDGTKPEVQSLGTVVIQARGRTETLQNVPISVKAFSAQAITDAGIKKPGDFVALSPNLSLAETQSVGTSFMTIRGLSQVRNGEAPMAVVVDGVAQSDAKQFTQELFDVQSIEVLRGPQGALYGRNASGGAILIRTKQPTNETTGFFQASVGTGNEKIVQGAISGAIVKDTLMFRLAGSYTDRAGYFDDLATHSRADAYKDKTLRGLLTWNATQDLTLDLRTSFVRDTAGGGAFIYQPTHLNANCTADLNNLFDFSRLDPNRVSRTFCNNNLGINTRSMDEATLKADYALGFATLTGIISHNKVNEYLSVDQFPYTASRSIAPGLDGTQTQFVDVSSDSYELRLTSPTQKGVRWMAGFYGLKTSRFVSTTTGNDLGHGVDFISYDPMPSSPTNPTASWFADHNRNRASAAFGNVDYDITPKVELSLAARYDRDHREQVVDYRQAAGTLPAACAASNVAACTKQATFSAMQPKMSLRYKADDGSLTYASVGRGFRSGQFNQSGVGALAASASPPVNGVQDQIGAEITTSAEIGYKTLLADGKIQLNAAAFRTQVKNAPYFVFIGAVGAQVLVPLDKVILTGGELELVAKVAPGLDAYAGVGVTQSKIDKYAVNPTLVGNQAPYVPQLGWNLGSQYRCSVMPSVNLTLRADVVNKGKQYWDPENSVARNAVTLLNLRAALEDAKGMWSTALSVSNATDKAYNAEWVAGGFTTPALPRIVRLDVRYNF